MQKVVLAGSGIAAKVITAYLSTSSEYSPVSATVDDEFVEAAEKEGLLPVVPISILREAHPPESCVVIMAMGYSDLNRGRRSLFERILIMGYGVGSWIAPGASVAPTAGLGRGCLVLPGSVVEPFAQVGDNTVLWSNVTVAHNSTVGSHCWLASGTVVSGQAQIGDHSFLGVNSTVVNDVVVGPGCFIGAGAVVMKNTQPNTVHIARGSECLRYSADEYVQHFLR